MGVLSNLEPKDVFSYFEYLSSVPHGSGNTKQVSDLCVRFAREHGLRCRQDALNNVIIWKDASPGCEQAAPVILQGHLDMVCAKADGCPLDMAREPIRLRTDGQSVWAEGTSLGGDDGVAVAMALAVLADDSLKHPPLEAVFTVDEEVGMDGAASTAYFPPPPARWTGSAALCSRSRGCSAATPAWRSTRAAPTQTT